MRPLVETAGVNGCLFTSPLGIQQFPVLLAIVNGFQNGRERKIVLLGNFLGSQRLRPQGFTIEDFGADAAVDGELLVARAALRLEVFVAGWLGHDRIHPGEQTRTLWLASCILPGCRHSCGSIVERRTISPLSH
jgi:hypothetical protein